MLFPGSRMIVPLQLLPASGRDWHSEPGTSKSPEPPLWKLPPTHPTLLAPESFSFLDYARCKEDQKAMSVFFIPNTSLKIKLSATRQLQIIWEM